MRTLLKESIHPTASQRRTRRKGLPWWVFLPILGVAGVSAYFIASSASKEALVSVRRRAFSMRAVASPYVEGECAPGYDRMICLPPNTPVNCSQLPVRNFRVHGADIHGLDGDGDGLACE